MSINRYIAKQFASPNGIAGRAVSFIMNRQNRPMYEETIRLLAISDSDIVLDIGCGNGYVLNMIAKQYDCRTAGIDISKSALNDALKRNHHFIKNKKMIFSHEDLSAMSFTDGTYCKAYSINTVYFWNDLNSNMKEINRVLKPAGVFVNTMYSNETLDRISHTQHGYRRFTAQELKSAGENAGFDVKAVPILNGRAFCYLYRKTAK